MVLHARARRARTERAGERDGADVRPALPRTLSLSTTPWLTICIYPFDPQVKKTRQPKTVQKGLEAAFRKRQNIKLKQSRDEVVAVLRRVLDEECADEASLRELFRQVAAALELAHLQRRPACL